MHVTDVRNVIIWGNHSSTQYPDVNHGTVKVRAAVRGRAGRRAGREHTNPVLQFVVLVGNARLSAAACTLTSRV